MNKLWWIEFIEGEFNAKKNVELEMILNHSEMDREIVENLMDLKTEIKLLDPTKLPTSPQYYANLEKSIMEKIKKETPKPPSEVKQAKDPQTQSPNLPPPPPPPPSSADKP